MSGDPNFRRALIVASTGNVFPTLIPPPQAKAGEDLAMSGDPNFRRALIVATYYDRIHGSKAHVFPTLIPPPQAKTAAVVKTHAVSPRPVRPLGWAESWLNIIECLVPARLRNEDIGDACEVIHRMAAEGRLRWRIALKLVMMSFWVLVNAVREVVAALDGRKAE
jgi:hypothetical protein